MFGIYGQENGVDIIPGEIGSNAITQGADNSGNTNFFDYTPTSNVFGSTNQTAAADNSGNTRALTAADTSGFPLSGLAGLNKWIADNKTMLTAAGAGAALLNNNSGIQKTGYQGSIPDLMAARTMVAAPPTRAQGYRPGAGGVNYGGDVSYVRTPGVDPWAYLSGTAGTASGANLNDNAGLYTAYLNNLNNAGGSTVTQPGGYGATTLTDPAAVAAAAAAKAAADAAALAASNKANAAAATAAAKAAADKAAADLAAATAAGNAAAIAAAQKAASDAAAAVAAANAAAKAAADKAAASKTAADAAAAAYTKAQADAAAAAKAAADAASGGIANSSFLSAAADLRRQNLPSASANDINTWLLNNPNATAAEIAAAAKAGNVNNTDIQNALQLSTFSPAVQYSILNGQGLDKLNANIANWVKGHPYATAEEIAAIKKASGVNDQDIANALTDKTASAGKEYALTHGMGLDEYYQNILDFQAENHSAAETAAAAKAAGVSQADIDAAAKFAQRQKEIDEWNAQNAQTTTETTTEKAPDLNASIAAILADKKTSTPDMTASLNSILAEKKAAAETPNLDSSLSAILAERKAAAQESTPNLNSSLSAILAERKAAAEEAAAQEETPNLDSSLAAILAERKAAETPSKPDNTNDIYSYFADPETQAALAAGDTRGIAETMQSLGWSPAEVAAATGSNPDEVQAAYDAALGTRNNTDYSYMQAAEGGYLKYAGGGEIAMAKGRYLQGGTDGMADEIPARIGRDQPAALSHGEFVVPADVVSHLGNGNSDAGAKKLYQMMDKIRMARTGNKKQGKKINPDKFMPGGLAQAYASGGKVQHFQEGGAAKNYASGLTGIESNLSNWAGPYVTNMLGQGQALANMPYQPYMGQLSSGAAPLQNAGFTTASNLSTPASLNAGAQTAADVAGTLKSLPAYGSTTFGNQFNAPDAYSPNTATNQFSTPTPYSTTTFANQYTAPTDIPEATKFTNQYTNTGAYTPTTSTFDQAQLQSYMNPYLESSLKPQLEEARRQSQLTQQQNAARMAQAGAYGGSRQAILDAENQRNLGTNLANITGQGYNTAYGNATNQFNADQTRKMQEAQFGAQQGMTAAQLQAQYGLSAQQANEMARQFESQQKMNAAQQFAQFGQTANQATEASKQFGAQMGMTAAQQAAQYGQSAQQQNELARQFAAQQGMTSAQQQAQYGLAGLQATEASKQFGANYGLQGLQTGLQAAQAQGTLGGLQSQVGLNNLNAQLTAGAQQRGIESEGIAADRAAFEEARANPYKMVQYQQSLLQGLPLAAQSYQGIEPTALVKAAQGATTVNQLLKNLGLIS
jgi:hypothetical protein